VRFFTRYVTDKISKGSEANGLTREEFIHQTLLSEDEGIIDEKESDVIENVLHLDEIKVRDILTPRRVMYAISLDDTIEEILADEKIYNFSRIPVMGEDIDDIIGIALSKKIFQKAMENKKTKINKLTQDIYKINENIPVSKALDLFIKRKEHMFLVVDGYNQTEGIITLEDCIETLLGVEIMDESDTHEDMRELAKKDMKKDRETEI
jgi:CBS domain containing-hemolysin-like protein